MKTKILLCALVLLGMQAINHLSAQCNVITSGDTTIYSGGSATLSASYSPGCSNVSYYWYPGQQTTTSIVVHPSSTAHYCVSGYCSSTGCWDSSCITVYVQQCNFVTSTSHSNPSCSGNDGLALVYVNGGTPPYTYLWSPGGQTTAFVTGLTPGTYISAVTDAQNNCTAYDTVSLSQYYFNSFAYVTTPGSCLGQNGAAMDSIIGGTPPYTYLWSPGGQTTHTATGLSVGMYTVTATDAHGCSSTDSIYVYATNGPIVQVQTNKYDSTATAFVSGGVAPYTYVWSPYGGTGQTAYGLIPGNYNVCVTDAGGCTSCSNFIMQQSCKVTVGGNTTIVAGGSTTLTASFNPSSVNTMYSWSPGQQTSQSIIVSPSATATYCVYGYDQSIGCGDSACITVYVQPCNFVATITQNNVSCSGKDGSASALVSGGIPPYTYLWTPGGQTTQSISGLSPGTYQVAVTDSFNSCTSYAYTVISQYYLSQYIFVTTPASCNGQNGAAMDSVFGGSPPFTYLWSNGQTTKIATGLSVGGYSVTVTDAHGCSHTDTTYMYPANGPAVTVQTNGSAGTASATVSGGIGPYTYVWNTSPVQNGQVATGLVPGNYAVCVTDGGGCQGCANFVIGHSACSNRDFEDGDFTNYLGETGTNAGNSNISWTGGLAQGLNDAPASGTDQHTIITVNTLDPLAIDPNTGLPDVFMTTLAPNGGNFSVRLGNSINGAQAEGLKVPFTVTATDTVFTYQFAGVYEDPAHNITDQPGFMVNVYGQSGVQDAGLSQTIYARDPLFSSNPFIVSTNMGPNGAPIVYRRWMGLSINLSAYVGQTVTLEFANFDCALTGHMGYTYLDGSCFGKLIANVWPGDCDYDLNANNVDLLSIGLAYGATGTTRTGATNNWVAQPSADWSKSFTLGANYKHSDCNGDGVVDIHDTVAISLNYGKTHAFRLEQPVYNNALSDIYLVAHTDSVGPNSLVNVDIMLGTNSKPVDSLYAIAFTITYDPSYFFNAFEMGANFATSWLGTAGNMITLQKNLFSAGQMDLALTRINHTNVSGGKGKIGTFTFRTTPVTSVNQGNISFMISGVKAITASGNIVSLNTVGDNVFFDPNMLGVPDYLDADLISVFPNPADKDLTVTLPSGLENASVELINLVGQSVMNVKNIKQAAQLDISSLPVGMYQMKISCDKGVAMKKIQVIR